MHVTDLISSDRIACGVNVSSKEHALKALSALIVKGEPMLSEDEAFDFLAARERLGSTGLGYGVAIPHGRCKECTQAVAAFIQLKKGVDFDAVDGQPVNLLFALIVPEKSTQGHLQLLAELAEMFSDSQLRERLAAAGTVDDLYALLTLWGAPAPQRSAAPGV